MNEEFVTLTTSSSGVDPIEFEVVSGALNSIAEEMSASLGRSSYSPIIREMLDYSCAIFDPKGMMVAQAENIPVQLSFLGYGLRSLLKREGSELFGKGDIVALNHPFRGGNHSPDLQLFKAVYENSTGKIIAFAGNTAHHLDMGGAEPGTEGFDNTEVFQEGLLFNGVKLFLKEIPNNDVFQIIRENVRNPMCTLGDIRAQIASINLAESRLLELSHKLGSEKLSFYMSELQNYSERRVNSELESIKDSEAYAEGFMDDDAIHPNKPVKIAAKVTKKGTTFNVDFTGSASQTSTGMNLPISNAYSAAYYALRCLLRDQTIPQNDGCFRGVTVVAPEGTIVNPRYPAAVSARHVTAERQVDTILRALSKIVPERLCAGCCLAFPTFNSETIDESGAVNIQTDILGGGYGGNAKSDGMDGVDVHLSNCGILPAEVCESESKLRIVRTELVKDSGGPGKHRGGLAILRTYRAMSNSTTYVNIYSDQGVAEFAPWGLGGGKAAPPARSFVTRIIRPDGKKRKPTGIRKIEVFPLKAHLVLEEGEEFTLVSTGGGGYGDPLQRDPELVLRDVLDGKVSRNAALKYYGVVINARKDIVEYEKTTKLRKNLLLLTRPRTKKSKH
jgi:N-methylhydantoinase B